MTAPRILALLTSGLVLFAALPALAQEAEQEGAVETGRFGDWIVHQNAGKGPKICFAASLPKAKEPAGANRAKIVFYVSAWPKEGIKSEVSVKLGYRIKPESEVAVTVGPASFTMFAQEDRAYISDSNEELKLIEAMRKGGKVVVKAMSARGTQTTDTYSLQGLAQALQAVATACPG